MKIAKAWTKTLVMKWLIGNKFEEFTLWVELAQILDQLGEVCERQEYLEKTTRWEWCKLDKGYRRNEKAMAPNFSILAWKIPWAEEPGGLQSMGSHRVKTRLKWLSSSSSTPQLERSPHFPQLEKQSSKEDPVQPKITKKERGSAQP